jgi:hypothetical protein
VEDLFWCSGNCNRTSNPKLLGFGPLTDGFGELESFSVEAIANDSHWFFELFQGFINAHIRLQSIFFDRLSSYLRWLYNHWCKRWLWRC